MWSPKKFIVETYTSETHSEIDTANNNRLSSRHPEWEHFYLWYYLLVWWYGRFSAFFCITILVSTPSSFGWFFVQQYFVDEGWSHAWWGKGGCYRVPLVRDIIILTHHMSILQNLGARMKWKYHSHKMKKMPQPLATMFKRNRNLKLNGLVCNNISFHIDAT
jgi:hypothetical protein